MKKHIFLLICLFFGFIVQTSSADSIQNKYPTLSNNLNPQTITVPSGQIEYYHFGHGTPLVLITGYFANVKSWSMSFLRALSAEHEVIIFDNRNVGGSFNSSTNYKTPDLAGDVNQLLTALHIAHADIFGVSMGGMIAQQFAISYPKKVDHLILMNTFIAGVQPTLPSAQVQADFYKAPKGKFKQYLMALRVLFPQDSRTKMFFVFLHDRFNPHTKEAAIVPAVVKQQQKLVFTWIKDIYALEKIKQFKMPVLILSGGTDYVIPAANSDVLKKTIPHAKLVRWENGGHAMIFQYPDEIGKVINDWLKH